MRENFLFPGKFYVAETKANGLMWVLPTPLRVVLENSFNCMNQIGMLNNPSSGGDGLHHCKGSRALPGFSRLLELSWACKGEGKQLCVSSSCIPSREAG